MTAAVDPNGRKRNTIQTARGTCALPCYHCRFCKQMQTCSRM